MDSAFSKLSKPVCPIDGFSFQQALAVSNEELALNPHVSDFVTQELTANLRKQIDEIEARKEEMLRQFFRTEENARQWGHLFVIEEKPSELITEEDEFGIDSTIFRLQQEWRLRMRTPEEMFGPYADLFMRQNKTRYSGTVRD